MERSINIGLPHPDIYGLLKFDIERDATTNAYKEAAAGVYGTYARKHWKQLMGVTIGRGRAECATAAVRAGRSATSAGTVVCRVQPLLSTMSE